jgi:ribosome biogenesis GTPase
MERAREGTVIRVEGAFCLVQLDGPGEGRVVRCPLRRALRFLAEGDRAAPPRGPGRLVAGDRVVLAEAANDPEPSFVIEGVRPRRTKFARRAAGEKRLREHVVAANVDQVAIVVAVREPEWNPGLVDRLLVAAEKGGLEPLILANKVDLLDAEGRAALERELGTYRAIGYRARATSVVSGEGLRELREALCGRTTVFAGPSGSGKSSLLNAIEPGLRLATGEVSRATRKGRHTTTSVSLLPLREGGFVVDTPGIREFGFFDVTPDELRGFFPEFQRAGPCRFPDCSHAVEPGCAVREAAEAEKIDRRRYESYLRMRESLAAGD